MAQDLTRDPEVDQEATHPLLTQRHAVTESNRSLSYDSNFSNNSQPWVRRNFAAECQTSDEERPDTARSSRSSKCSQPSPVRRSSLRSFLPRPLRGTEEYHDHHAGARYYPEAGAFFAVDATTSTFRNPLVALPSNQGNRSASPPSPYTRPNDRPQVLPVSPFSNYSQSEDAGIPLSPLSSTRHDRRESGVFGLGIRSAPVILERVPDRSSPPPAYSSGGELFSTLALDRLIDELEFDNAAYEFFSAIDVQGLLTDQRSGKYAFEDHDDQYAAGLDPKYDWPCYHWLPHDSVALSRGCPCRQCSEAWTLEDEEKMNPPHDFDPWCSCPTCKLFQSQDLVDDIEKQRLGHELVRSYDPKRKHAELEDEDDILSASRYEPEVRRKLRREIRTVSTAQVAKEDEDMPASENPHEESEGEEKKGCLRVWDMIKQMHRQPPTPSP